jgi:hypothetical protein
MDYELVKTFLAIWGAVLSTILAVIAIQNFRKENQNRKLNVSVVGTVDPPFENLKIYAYSNGSKPATIVGYTIGIGRSENGQRQILKYHLTKVRKLDDSDHWSVAVSRSTIQSAYKELKRPQQYFQRLWINVILSTGKTISNPVYIDPKIISWDYYEKAEAFIATDVFLDLPPMKSIFEPIGSSYK